MRDDMSWRRILLIEYVAAGGYGVIAVVCTVPAILASAVSGHTALSFGVGGLVFLVCAVLLRRALHESLASNTPNFLTVQVFLATVFLVGSVAFIVLVANVYLTVLRGRIRYEAYNSLEFGETATSLQTDMGTEPIVRVTFDDWEVWYFSRPGFIDTSEEGAMRAVERTDPAKYPEDLPSIYAAFQFLVDGESQEVVARTQNEETGTIETAVGPFPGWNISHLPPEAWERLDAWRGALGDDAK